jgi:hypothetical protein
VAYDIVSLVPVLCDGFIGKATFAEGGIALVQHLPQARLDFSVESLHFLDEYLPHVAENLKVIDQQSITNTILGAGCYVGETIRRNSTIKFRWENYHDYFSTRPQLAAIFIEEIGTAAVLAAPDQMTAPISKVVRFLYEGPENNIHFYATGYLRPRV